MLYAERFYALALKEICELKQKKPELEPLLDYHEAVLKAQRETKSSFHLDLNGLDVELCRERISEGMPLLKPEDVKIDWNLFDCLFDRISHINQHRAEAPDSLCSELIPCDHDSQWHAILLKALFEDNTLLEPLADRAGVRPELFTFFAGQTLTPFLETYAERLRKHIDDLAWFRGYCPICGGEPLMGKLAKETGKRLLKCHLCRTEWVFKRLECPFCGNSDQEKLRFFYDQEEATLASKPVYRIEVCDRCKTYLKTVDTRETERDIPLLVENLATLDLDLVAKREGFWRETTRLFGV